MRRFWFDVADGASARPDTPLASGVDVTAWNPDQASRMIEAAFGPLPDVARVVEDVDVSALGLSPWEVGVPVRPGVWKPPVNLWDSDHASRH